jgi:hypothetical protein
VNTILETEQPYFNLIKTYYPHYHCGRGKSGHVVFYERPGDLNRAQVLPIIVMIICDFTGSLTASIWC